MQYYFAYGSNLHHAQMKRRCPKCRYIKKHILHNYQLTFRSKYGAADIERKVGKKVYGALYIISKCAERRLDVYEEYPPSDVEIEVVDKVTPEVSSSMLMIE